MMTGKAKREENSGTMNTNADELRNHRPPAVACARRDSKARLRIVSSGLATEALAPARPKSTTLIISDVGLGRRPFSDVVGNAGRCSITVQHPLEAIICLQDKSLGIGVVLAPANDARFSSLEFFAFMRDTFPLVRRYSYAKRASIDVDAPNTDSDRRGADLPRVATRDR
jgi:hypothetical protein